MTRQIKDILQDLAKTRGEAQEAYSYYKSLNDNVGMYRTELDAALREYGLKKATTDDGLLTGYFSKRKSVNVFSPDELKQWLEENKFIVNDYFAPVNRRVERLVDMTLKETGEVVPGVEVHETETLSLRENKPKEETENADNL